MSCLAALQQQKVMDGVEKSLGVGIVYGQDQFDVVSDRKFVMPLSLIGLSL